VRSTEAHSERDALVLTPIGIVRSPLTDRETAPSQGNEGAPDAVIELEPSVLEGLDGIEPGQEIVLVTWFHLSRRDVLRLHPRWDSRNPLTGVFNTRSPDRPNPVGLHRVTVFELDGRRLRVGPLEAIDGTPVIDIKPVLRPAPRRQAD
jgi:tRNA-Thr(GGU) m(6)t(6)A37 methyltransferase TsaA